MVFQVGFHRCIFSLLINLDRFALKRKNQVKYNAFDFIIIIIWIQSLFFSICAIAQKRTAWIFFILVCDKSFYKYLPKISRSFLTLPLFAQCFFESSSSDQLMNTCLQLFLEVYYDVFAWNFTKLLNSEALIFFSLFLVYFPKTNQEASENCNHADLTFLMFPGHSTKTSSAWTKSSKGFH